MKRVASGSPLFQPRTFAAPYLTQDPDGRLPRGLVVSTAFSITCTVSDIFSDSPFRKFIRWTACNHGGVRKVHRNFRYGFSRSLFNIPRCLIAQLLVVHRPTLSNSRRYVSIRGRAIGVRRTTRQRQRPGEPLLTTVASLYGDVWRSRLGGKDGFRFSILSGCYAPDPATSRGFHGVLQRILRKISCTIPYRRLRNRPPELTIRVLANLGGSPNIE